MRNVEDSVGLVLGVGKEQLTPHHNSSLILISKFGPGPIVYKLFLGKTLAVLNPTVTVENNIET